MSNHTLLYVEDEEDDAFLMKRALHKAGIKHPLHVVTDGEQAIDYLMGRGVSADHAGHPLPDLVLLDLNLPRKSGLEVLQWIREQPDFLTLRVLVFSASSNEWDIHQSYALGANSFLTKPTDFEGLVAVVHAIQEFCFVHSQRPPDPSQFQ